MDKNHIEKYKQSLDAVLQHIEGDDGQQIEVWFARELQSVLGYVRWENFAVAINRAIESCKTQGIEIDDHFREVTKMVVLGSGAKRERGVDDKGFGRIRSKGDQALFGGHTTEDMKNRLGIKSTRPLADFLTTLTIAAKNLATEMTNYNVEENDLYGEESITAEHIQNNTSIRKMLGQRGIKPEKLPVAEDIKKIERKVSSNEKKIESSTKKLPKGK